VAETHRGCPVSHTDYTRSSPLYEHYGLLDHDRERARFLYNDTTDRGFFMLQRYDDVREAFQQPGTWTTAVRSALRPQLGEPLLPQDLNGAPHAKLRRILNQFFAPSAVRRMEPLAREHCARLIEQLRPAGSCDFVAQIAIRYPSDLFLALLGLPVSDGGFFLDWSEEYFGSLLAGDPARAVAAKRNIIGYFDQAVRERRKNPLDPRQDLVSRLVEAEIDGAPIAHDDILTICLTLMLAGLDTTRSALGFAYAHLADHPEDRQLIVDDPALIPAAVEEFLRLYPLVFQVGREVQQDQVFHDLELRRGDVVWIGVGQANHDPRAYPDPERFLVGRPGANQHFAFGAGPHRCLGSHLARRELKVALEEWHRVIPDYRLGDGEPITEFGRSSGVNTLPLAWDA
jgi:cytochrome P450